MITRQIPRPARFALAAALVSLCVAGAASATSGAAASVCGASNLKGKLLDSSGAAGTILFSVTLKNTGSTCTLKGYAGLKLYKGSTPLPTQVIHGGLVPLNKPVKKVTLVHNGRATILIAYEDVPSGSQTSCPNGTALRIKPPGQSGTLTVKVKTTACGGGKLRESPVLPGVQHAL